MVTSPAQGSIHCRPGQQPAGADTPLSFTCCYDTSDVRVTIAPHSLDLSIATKYPVTRALDFVSSGIATNTRRGFIEVL
jgi:hypothetical protein